MYDADTKGIDSISSDFVPKDPTDQNLALSIGKPSVVRFPIGVVSRSEVTRNQEEDVDDPPNSEPTKGHQLSNRNCRITKTKPIHCHNTEKHRVQQR